jgi:hypothetical protein
MPDTKITALTAIGANPIIPATFPIPMVDLTDTSMAASGTTKKVTVNQILGAGGTATLASATITGDLTVDTNVLKVDTSLNRVGINTASPTVALEVAGSATITGNLTVDSNTLVVTASTDTVCIGATTTDAKFRILDGSGNGVRIGFSPGVLNYNLYDATVHEFRAVGGANSFGAITANGIGLGVTPSASGIGVAFPATQSASSDANTLDDYEEGTFTPTIVGTSTAGTASYSVQSGLYTKVGRVVTIQIYIAWTGGTGTGNLSMAGLPFTSGGTNYGILSVYPLNIALTAGYYLGANVNLNATTIGLFQLPTGGGADAAIPYDAAGSLLFTGTYFV